jgi:hypothetical protein
LIAQRDHSRTRSPAALENAITSQRRPSGRRIGGLAMPVSGVIARAMVAAVIVLATPVGGSAQPTLKIFDAHLHYNQIRAGFLSSCADTRYH